MSGAAHMAGFYRGPADGARVSVPEGVTCILVAWKNEIHGYQPRGDGEFVHGGLLATSGNPRAADVLRLHGREHVELKDDGTVDKGPDAELREEEGGEG